VSLLTDQYGNNSAVRIPYEVGFFSPGRSGFQEISVAEPGCLSRITDTNIYHPGSEFFPSRIRSFSILDPGSASKNLSSLTQKIFSKLSKNMIRVFHPGSGTHLGSRIKGVKKAPDPVLRIRNTVGNLILKEFI
jgi:hypothetical protein